MLFQLSEASSKYQLPVQKTNNILIILRLKLVQQRLKLNIINTS